MHYRENYGEFVFNTIGTVFKQITRFNFELQHS